MRKIIIYIFLLFFVFSFNIYIKAGEKEIEIRRLQRLINTGGSNEVINLLLKAEQDGLPVDGLINKVKEGTAKQIEIEKIIKVLYAKRNYLEKAKAILKDGEQKGLRVYEYENNENIENLAKAIENGADRWEIENLMQLVIKNNEDVRYLLQASNTFADLVKAKLDRQIIRDILTIAVEKRINVYVYSEIADFLIEAKRNNSPLSEITRKLKQGIQEDKDIREIILDIRFAQ